MFQINDVDITAGTCQHRLTSEVTYVEQQSTEFGLLVRLLGQLATEENAASGCVRNTFWRENTHPLERFVTYAEVISNFVMKEWETLKEWWQLEMAFNTVVYLCENISHA